MTLRTLACLRRPQTDPLGVPTYRRSAAQWKLAAFQETVGCALNAEAHRAKQNRPTPKRYFCSSRLNATAAAKANSLPSFASGAQEKTRLHRNSPATRSAADFLCPHNHSGVARPGLTCLTSPWVNRCCSAWRTRRESGWAEEVTRPPPANGRTGAHQCARPTGQAPRLFRCGIDWQRRLAHSPAPRRRRPVGSSRRTISRRRLGR